FPPNDRTCAGSIGAALTMPLVDEVLSIPVIALATGTPGWQLFRTNVDVRLGGMIVRLVLTVIALFAIAKQIVFVIVAPLVMAAIQFISSNRLRERAERAAWQKLAQTTDEFNEVDLDIVLRSAVKRAAELFSADKVDVRVAVPVAMDRLVLGDADGVQYDGPGGLAPSTASHPIAVPLTGHDGATAGELRLLFRGNKVALSEREQFTLRAFAAALSTAIRNASAFAETKRLAAEHAHAAKHDPLTDLANRRQLHTVGDDLLAARARPAPSRHTARLARAEVAAYLAERAASRHSVLRRARGSAHRGRLALPPDPAGAVARRESTATCQPTVGLVTGQVLATDTL